MTPINGSPDDPGRSEAIEVAVEHVLWAAEKGIHPGDVMNAIGCEWPNRSVDTQTVVTALALAWRKITRR